jgi:hypothetical protein
MIDHAGIKALALAAALLWLCAMPAPVAAANRTVQLQVAGCHT